MHAVLHVVALLPAAVGVGALVGMRRDAGRPEILVAALMLAGMADVMTVSLLPPVLWFAVLVIVGIVLAAVRRAAPVPTARPEAMVSTHLALGVITTAVLVLLMPGIPSPAAPPIITSHVHGAVDTMPLLVSAGLALGTVILAVVALRTERAWPHRLHHATMAVSTVAMCAIVAT